MRLQDGASNQSGLGGSGVRDGHAYPRWPVERRWALLRQAPERDAGGAATAIVFLPSSGGVVAEGYGGRRP